MSQGAILALSSWVLSPEAPLTPGSCHSWLPSHLAPHQHHHPGPVGALEVPPNLSSLQDAPSQCCRGIKDRGAPLSKASISHPPSHRQGGAAPTEGSQPAQHQTADVAWGGVSHTASAIFQCLKFTHSKTHVLDTAPSPTALAGSLGTSPLCNTKWPKEYTNQE